MTDPTGAIPPIKAVEGLVKAAYQDLVHPAAEEVGKTLGGVVRVALSPVRALVWGGEQIGEYVHEAVTRKLREVPGDRIQTPDPNIAGPALEALRFAGPQENLRELYANLLATAMDRDTARRAHPAFVEVIKQLAPDEARILSWIGRTGGRQPMPLISISQGVKDTPSRKMVRPHFSMLGEHAGCEHVELTASYVVNLCRLGVAEIPVNFAYANAAVYAPLEAHPTVVALTTLIEGEGGIIVIDRETLRLTTFGNQFLDACVIEKVAE